MVRTVSGAGRPIHEEWLVRRERLVALHPRQRVLGQILAQVILLVVRRLDRIEILEQPRLPLRGLAGEEAVEVVETDSLTGRPERERPHRRRLGRWRVVPFAERGRLVAVGAKHLRQGGGGSRNHAGVAVPIHRALGDGAGTDALMIAAGQQCGTRRRADRRSVKRVVADALIRDARQRGRPDRATVGVRQSEADVVQQDDQNVGRILGQMALHDAGLVLRVLQGRRGYARRRGRWKGQHRTVVGYTGRVDLYDGHHANAQAGREPN